MRWAWLALLVSVGCGDHSEVVVVTVTGVPDGATRLVARSALDDRLANDEAFDPPASGFGSTTSFGLKLPSGQTGRLSLGVQVDVGGCASAWESIDATLTGARADLTIDLKPVTPPDCSGSFQRTPGMIAIPAGMFVMGCSAASCLTDEAPVRRVTLSAFEIDRIEVPVASYNGCVAAGQCDPELGTESRGDRAQSRVTWFDADSYCRFRGKRLLTEAEWERAARGVEDRHYPWGNTPDPDCAHAVYDMCHAGGDAIAVVASHPAGATPDGVLDLAGNVMEWVGDWYHSSYDPTDLTNPTGPLSGDDGQRSLRGSNTFLPADTLRTTFRWQNPPDGSDTSGTLTPDVNTFGFGIRCARSL
jgi:formylglycine-generating enzyme required for sulfatase activity